MALRHDHFDEGRADDRTIVVVFLRGGADGLTLVPPCGDDGYQRARPVLGVSAADAIALDGTFHLNPALAPLRRHFDDGRLRIVHGAGSGDTTRSHFEAQDLMEHGGERGGGWLGRFLLARAHVPGPLDAVAIGTTLPEALRGAPGGTVIQSIDDVELAGDPALFEAISGLYGSIRSDPSGLARGARGTLEAIERLHALRAEPNIPANGAEYPDSGLGRGLREVARLKKANVGLVASTIDSEGWDTHFVQQSLIGGLMDDLARSLDAFHRDLGSHASSTTVVVMTEFGRRVQENTSFGTDHGRGSVMVVLDDDPPGGAGVEAHFDSLAQATLEGPGDLPVSIDYRDVLRPILQRHEPGLDLSEVLGQPSEGHRTVDHGSMS
jgi:uncharacterized protein (DUF1501 family)